MISNILKNILVVFSLFTPNCCLHSLSFCDILPELTINLPIKGAQELLSFLSCRICYAQLLFSNSGKRPIFGCQSFQMSHCKASVLGINDSPCFVYEVKPGINVCSLKQSTSNVE